MNLVQVNLQSHFGGGEIYTAFLCRALSRLGVPTRLLVDARADFWSRLGLPADCQLHAIDSPAESGKMLPVGPVWLLGHGPLPAPLCSPRNQVLRSAIAHMPVGERDPRAFFDHDIVFAVSRWVARGLDAHGIRMWPEPLYGVADLGHRDRGIPRRTSRYDWDRRKGRDRLFGYVEPLVEALRPHPAFRRRPGLSLGIVSRITPIKQFPDLFRQLAPVLARRPQVNLEIFGAGGYASIRDLDRALRPCAGQVRFWGQQEYVGSVYRQIDWLLTGLPEKEALGLNVIEAQACGTPVLAIDAPPFEETVVEGRSGRLFRDPRNDNGADFGRVLDDLISGAARPDPREDGLHLARFTMEGFIERLRPVLAHVQTLLNVA